MKGDRKKGTEEHFVELFGEEGNLFHFFLKRLNCEIAQKLLLLSFNKNRKLLRLN
jgi:hypothetical protein